MFKISEANEVEVAFGARNIDKMMPEYNDIPDEFKGMFSSKNKWVNLVEDMFFRGVKNIKLIPREGVDEGKAFKHIRSVMVSFRPKHEHKTAACAFLFNEWFSDGTWEANKEAKTH